MRYCKESLNIGGELPAESYLCIDKIIDAAKKLDCEFIHPGYGFLAESYEFSKRCEVEGFIFVGPSSETLELSSDKARAREVAAGVTPILPGKEVSTDKEAIDLASKIGYPVIIKAVKGGGGRGLRIVRSEEELARAFESSKKESSLSFGSARSYIEKYLENPRHIEVQILADGPHAIHLGERECSVQRKHQKLIEETPSPALTKEIRRKITDTAVAIMKEVKYRNSGTVEFLFKDGRFYFMEVNSRIQVEHPITEEVTGVDIVEQQLKIASGAGLELKQDKIKSSGHAIECRINAEHPIDFTPFPGTVTKFIPPPVDEGIRIDTVLYSGYSIPPFYDSLIAKLICHEKDRSSAIERMKAALLSFRISWIPSTIPFHISALNDQRFLQGDYNTSFINELKPFATKEGEKAAAVLSQLLHHRRQQPLKIIKTGKIGDPWLKSRHHEIEFTDMNRDYHLISRWRK
jgi:acetyl/propionyl-CoA carboxylase alpha subunit